MNHATQIPFASGWWSFDLGTYRPCDSTYCLFSVADLPPIPWPLDATLGWLPPLSETIERQMTVYRNDPAARGRVDAIAAEAARRGLTLPRPFARFMSTPELQDRIPSCTACTFELGDQIVACPGSEGAYIVSFLRDQQDCVLWYLYLTPSGEHAVLAFPGDLGSFITGEPEAEGKTVDMAAVVRHIMVAAPSFTAFLYRFWLENTIWFKLNGDDKTPLTAEERHYLEHYRPRRLALLNE